MKTFSKRLLTMLLAVSMVFGLSGMTAFAAEAEDGIATLAYDGEYPDIEVYKNGVKVQTITGEEFKAAEEKAPYVKFEMRRGSTTEYTDVWANFVLVSDLLDDGVAPDPDCGALMENTPWASMEDLYIYMTEDGTYRMAVNGASGSTGWYNGITTITLGHDFDANGDCNICGHSRLDYIDYNVRYAVCLWGIEQNEDRYGNKLGLTFGPATGADYTNTYEAHLTQAQYESGEYGVCLHWMTWEEIIEQSAADPGAFEECFENGCTHSVNLKLNSTLLRTSYEDKMNSGDGAGMLYDSIAATYRNYNSTNRNDGGWPASQMRATLNGKDRKTGENAANALDAGNCLLSCFPSELQSAIVPTAVASDTVWDSQTEEDCKTTYDKLWIPSGTEVYADAGSNNALIRPNEGELSQRSLALGISTTENRGVLANYDETGTTQSWRLRSMGTTSAQSNYLYQVEGDGNWYRGAASTSTIGIAPCFCLRGTQDETDDSYYDVKYAVSVWGINHDTDENGDVIGLTFGPATGKNYTDDYEAHLSEEAYDPQNGKYCLHWMTWDEIVTQAAIDPTVFEECMEYGCTHAVNITLNDEIGGSSYVDEMDDGDGVGILYNSIAYEYLRWNDYSVFTSGGWAASKSRAMLNGQDDLLSPNNGDTLDEEHCLFSCFPEVLQDAIVPKAVNSAAVFGGGEDDIVTTYDPLWLFATVEVWGSEEQDARNAYLNSAEGTLYERSSAMGITLSQYGALTSYDEEGGTHQTWTRSLYGTDNVAVMGSAGAMQYYYINSALASAPCFCVGVTGEQESNKTALQTEYDADKTLIEEQYTAASWASLKAALEAAKVVLDDADAAQDDVNEALAALQTAREGLDEVTYPDITIVKDGETVRTVTDAMFKELQEAASEQTFTMNRSSGASTEFTARFVPVTDLLGDCQPDAGCGVNFGTNWLEMDDLYIFYRADNQTFSIAVDQALDSSGGWTDGVTGITVGHDFVNGVCSICGEEETAAVDKTDLEEEIAAVEKEMSGLSKDDYTTESWEALEAALAAAQEVLQDANAAQEDVEAAKDALKTALDNLVKKDDGSGTGGNDGDGGTGKTDVVDLNGTWTYTVDGKADYSYTGFASNAYGKWWVDNGVVRFNVTDIRNDANGALGSRSGWYYVSGSKVQEGYTGVSNFANAYGWWYIDKGKVDFSVSSVEENQYGWWNVEGGKVIFSNTVAQNRYGWWYCSGGKVDFGFSGLGNHGNAYGWWYIRSGKVDFSVNTVAQNNNGWWYVEGGKVDFGYTGVSNYENPYGWWYIKNGKVDFGYNGTASNRWGTWNVVSGKVRF